MKDSLFSGSRDGSIKIWNLARQKKIAIQFADGLPPFTLDSRREKHYKERMSFLFSGQLDGDGESLGFFVKSV
jgi:WD40 repeat protein